MQIRASCGIGRLGRFWALVRYWEKLATNAHELTRVKEKCENEAHLIENTRDEWGGISRVGISLLPRSHGAAGIACRRRYKPCRRDAGRYHRLVAGHDRARRRR